MTTKQGSRGLWGILKKENENMCQFFSGLFLKEGQGVSNFLSGIILYKNRKLIYDPFSDSHEDLIRKSGLNDSTDRPNFVRLELLPKNGDICNQDLDNWYLKVDQDLRPDWFDPEIAEAMMREALQKVWAEAFTIGGEYDEIKDRKIRIVKDARIINLINSQVGEMWGSSQVGKMRESSQVGEMWESSQVGEMWESSQVGEMWGSSQVGEMRGSSQVGEMRGSSQVGKMRESSQVGEMRESSQVGEMWGSSQVGEMRESSQVGEMWESSQVGEMWESSLIRVFSKHTVIKNMNDSSILVGYYGDNPIIIAPNQKIKIKKP
jgi:hypothetical protein